jgi:hypothetical protein
MGDSEECPPLQGFPHGMELVQEAGQEGLGRAGSTTDEGALHCVADVRCAQFVIVACVDLSHNYVGQAGSFSPVRCPSAYLEFN